MIGLLGRQSASLISVLSACMLPEKPVSIAGMGNGTRKLNYRRSAIVLLASAVFILVIPSLPAQKYHLLFWAIAFILESALLIALWPLDSN
jgi:hypothetical protein